MSNSGLNPTKKFDFISRSAVIRGEKATKPVTGKLSTNPHLPNKLHGYLEDKLVVVAQRPDGKGGMDFNKLVGDKVFAVAADGISPVYEKDEAGKATRVQKLEEGLPYYSSSGFYTLSSKEYPALIISEAYLRLLEDGNKMVMVTTDQLERVEMLPLLAEDDWEMFVQESVANLLDNGHNLVAAFDEKVNTKRRRGIDSAKTTAEDNDETYAGIEFKELACTHKDGRPAIVYSWREPGGERTSGMLLQEVTTKDASDRPTTRYDETIEATLARFKESDDGKAILALLREGRSVELALVQGHVMRSSPQFRRKVENVRAQGRDRQLYGDAVFVWGALDGWVRGIVSVIHSMHPKFPADDYEALYYVAAARQLEVGMTKIDGKLRNPTAVHYDLEASLM